MHIGKALMAGSLLAASFILTGCNGDGGDEISGNDPAPEGVVITPTNAPAVTAGVADSVKLSKEITEVLYQTVVASVPQIKNVAVLLPSSVTLMDDLQRNDTVLLEPRTVDLSGIGNLECSEGGELRYTGNDGRFNVILDRCIEQGFTFNGEIGVNIQDRYHVSITTQDFNITSQLFDIDYGATSVDTVLATIPTLHEVNATVNARIDLKDQGNARTYAYDDFHLYVGDIDTRPMRITGEGNVTTPCADGPVKVETKETLVQPSIRGCPTAGKLGIAGENSEAELVFNGDGSSDLYFQGQIVEHYDSCRDLPDRCPQL
ncbi:hypothetical protein [Hydrogenimonas sp.]